LNASLLLSDTAFRGEPPWIVRRGGGVLVTTSCGLNEVLMLLGEDVEGWAGSCRVGMSRVRGGAVFLDEGDAAGALHVVRSGSFKSLRTATDGYEQVHGFAGRGDMLGFESLVTEQHALRVVALEDSTVLALPLHELNGWRRRSPTLDRAVMRALGSQLLRATEIASMMAAVASEVRLARFLVWMSQRMAASGQSPRRFLLRMSRRDIASLLAVASETISRGFGLLVARGHIAVDNREVEILDMAGLKAATVCTRRDRDEPAGRQLPRMAESPAAHAGANAGSAGGAPCQVLPPLESREPWCRCDSDQSPLNR
jgi:CRP/FNR family transcriptional regulator